jgi:hypothetical protein
MFEIFFYSRKCDDFINSLDKQEFDKKKSKITTATIIATESQAFIYQLESHFIQGAEKSGLEI